MRSIPDAVVVAEFESGEVVAANEATERLFDARPQDLIGLHHLQLHPEDDADRYREAFHRGLESNRVSHLSDGSHLHVETMSGEQKPVEINAQRLQADGKTFVLGVFRDVSEQVAKEQQLEQATVRLETLLDSTPLPVAVLDTGGRVQLWNRAAEDVFGYSPEEVVGERYPLLVNDSELDRLVERLLDGERVTDYETVQRGKDGSRIDVALYVRPLYQEGEITGFIGSGIDISDRKRRQQHLDVTHRVLRHNLRNNLSVIQGYASLISEEAAVGSSEREAADSITAAAEELAELSDHASQATDPQTAGHDTHGGFGAGHGDSRRRLRGDRYGGRASGRGNGRDRPVAGPERGLAATPARPRTRDHTTGRCDRPAAETTRRTVPERPESAAVPR